MNNLIKRASPGLKKYVNYLRDCCGNLLPRWVSISVSSIVLLYWLTQIRVQIKFFNNPDINGYGYSEMLINYEGGFVRRGLFGQILYYINELTGIPPIPLIQAICLSVMAIVILYFVNRFYRLKLNWWILAFPLLLGGVTECVRKDWMQYALLIWIFWLIHDINPPKWKLVCAVILCIAGLFLHEAFIFWGIPVVMLSLLVRKQTRRYGIIGSVSVIAVFLLLSAFKGSQQQATDIIYSWKHIQGCESIIYEYYNGIGALSWDAGQTMARHLYYNFSNGYAWWLVIPVRLLWMLVIYYFLTNFLFVFKKDNINSPGSDKTSFSVMILFSFLCLIPMFTVLSCDWIRLSQYAAVTTFGAFITFTPSKFKSLFSERILVAVAKFNQNLDKVVKPTAWLMIVLLLFIAATPVFFMPENCLRRGMLPTLILNISRHIWGIGAETLF